MMEIVITVADFSPATAPIVFACSPGAIGFSTLPPERKTTWLALDGSGCVAEPKEKFPVDCEPSNAPRIDPIAPGWRLEMEASPMSFLLISRTKNRVVVDVPAPLVADVLAIEKQRRPEVVLAREIDTLAIRGKHGVWWFPVARLIELEGASSVRWRIRKVLPTSNRAARDEGEVVISAYGRTNIRVGRRAVMIGQTSLTKGERVMMVDLLADTNGILRYREIVRADGERIPIEQVSADDEITTTSVRNGTSGEKADAPIPTRTQRVIDAMQREGLLADMTPALYTQIARPEGSWRPTTEGLSPFDLLYGSYNSDSERAERDRYIEHEARFAKETDDVIAELSALLGGEPVFVQVRAGRESLRVRGREGERTIDLDEGFDGVVHVFNEALRARNDPRRFFLLESHDVRRCFLLLATDAWERLRRDGVPLERVGG
jgi:hypothetical protein